MNIKGTPCLGGGMQQVCISACKCVFVPHDSTVSAILSPLPNINTLVCYRTPCFVCVDMNDEGMNLSVCMQVQDEYVYDANLFRAKNVHICLFASLI